VVIGERSGHSLCDVCEPEEILTLAVYGHIRLKPIGITICLGHKSPRTIYSFRCSYWRFIKLYSSDEKGG